MWIQKCGSDNFANDQGLFIFFLCSNIFGGQFMTQPLHFVMVQRHTNVTSGSSFCDKKDTRFFLIKHDISAISGICGERLSLMFMFHVFESQHIKSYQKAALEKNLFVSMAQLPLISPYITNVCFLDGKPH